MSYRPIDSVHDLVSELRMMRFEHGGRVFFSNFTSIGSYPITFVFADGERSTPGCVSTEVARLARDIRDSSDDRIIAVEIYFEGPTVEDCLSGAPIQSAYGDPASEGDEP